MIKIKNLLAMIYVIRFDGEPMYVGQTRMGMKSRLRSHFNATGGSRCWRLLEFFSSNPEMNRYECEVLEATPLISANERERYWIDRLGTYDRGLNMNQGGNIGGSEHYLSGCKIDPQITKASIAARRGKPLSEGHRAKISASNMRSEHKGRRRIVREDGAVFPSLSEAARSTGVHNAAILSAIRNAGRSGGFRWRYSDEPFATKKDNRRNVPIICNETGKTYPSCLAAAKEYNLAAANLTHHLNGKQKTFGGHTFRSVEK